MYEDSDDQNVAVIPAINVTDPIVSEWSTEPRKSSLTTHSPPVPVSAASTSIFLPVNDTSKRRKYPNMW